MKKQTTSWMTQGQVHFQFKRTLTSGFSTHLIDTAAGEAEAGDEHNDEDHNPHYYGSKSNITVTAVGQIKTRSNKH